MHSKFVGDSTDIVRQSKTNAPLPTQHFHKERAKIGFFSHNLVCILKFEMECLFSGKSNNVYQHLTENENKKQLVKDSETSPTLCQGKKFHNTSCLSY